MEALYNFNFMYCPAIDKIHNAYVSDAQKPFDSMHYGTNMFQLMQQEF